MVSMSRLVEFLMDLMRDEKTKAAFDANPDGTLADCGLQGVTPRDISDAEMVMRDSGLVHPRTGGSTAGGYDNSPVEAIRNVSTNYMIDQSVDVGDIHEEFTVVDIDVDDRDVDIS